jgi:hypothetical protein
MSLEWSELPGTRSFVERLVGDLREGKSAVLCLPAHAPVNLRSAVRTVWHAAEERFHPTIDLRDYPELALRPLELLYRHFLPDAPERDLREIGKLLESSAFAGQIIWIDGIGDSNRTIWSDFLRKYQDVSRNSETRFRQTVFVLPYAGNSAVAPPEEEIGLVVHRWRGVTDILDAMLYAASLYRRGAAFRTRKENWRFRLSPISRCGI